MSATQRSQYSLQKLPSQILSLSKGAQPCNRTASPPSKMAKICLLIAAVAIAQALRYKRRPGLQAWTKKCKGLCVSQWFEASSTLTLAWNSLNPTTHFDWSSNLQIRSWNLQKLHRRHKRKHLGESAKKHFFSMQFILTVLGGMPVWHTKKDQVSDLSWAASRLAASSAVDDLWAGSLVAISAALPNVVRVFVAFCFTFYHVCNTIITVLLAEVAITNLVFVQSPAAMQQDRALQATWQRSACSLLRSYWWCDGGKCWRTVASLAWTGEGPWVWECEMSLWPCWN